MFPSTKPTTTCNVSEQIFANLKLCFPPKYKSFEIVTADKNGLKTAWAVEKTEGAIVAIMKGPPCETSGEALEGLLETTSVLVGQALENVFFEFQIKPSEMVGDGFLREDRRPEKEMGEVSLKYFGPREDEGVDLSSAVADGQVVRRQVDGPE